MIIQKDSTQASFQNNLITEIWVQSCFSRWKKSN